MKEYAGKKILIIVENLPVPFDRRVWQEAITLKDRGAEVFVICPTGKGHEKKIENIDGIKIYRHNLILEAGNVWGYFFEYTSAFFWEVLLSWWIFLKYGFDVIHACNPPDLIFLVALPFKLLGKKFVFDHHDINPELYLAKFGRKDIFYKLVVFLEKTTYKICDVSIATNNSYKEIAINRGKMNPQDVFVVRSGPDLNRIKKIPANDKFKNGKKYLIGYVGVIGKQEGLNYLIDGVEYIIYEKKRKDIHFTCIGDGPYLKNIKNYAKRKNVLNNISFTGRIPDKDMLEILNASDICLNLDEYNEMNDKSTMNKIMEYMALGKPIVQFDLKEGRVTAQDASLYARPNDSIDLAKKIFELIDNPQKREEMGKFGYKRVRSKLCWERERFNLYKVYDKLFFEKN